MVHIAAKQGPKGFFEHTKGISLPDGKVNGQRRRWNQPTVIARPRHGAAAVKQRGGIFGHERIGIKVKEELKGKICPRQNAEKLAMDER
jgi:hypothetical protein